MPLKNPLAMTTDEVHSAVWTLQLWGKNLINKDRIPFVFQGRMSPTPGVGQDATPFESGVQSRRARERVQDSDDERIVEPQEEDNIDDVNPDNDDGKNSYSEQTGTQSSHDIVDSKWLTSIYVFRFSRISVTLRHKFGR